MPRRLTQEEFITKARGIHGDKYDYSKVIYNRGNLKVCIICPKHGEFWQQPANHLRGHGCYGCKSEYMSLKTKNKPKYNIRHLIYGVGINDIDVPLSYKNQKSYHVWRQILFRCYSKKGLEKRKTYRGCTVCEEWHKFSNFKKWFDEKYIEGWCIDKDILSHPNKKIYSPDTCCFVPNEINVLFNRHQSQRSKTGIMGVQFFRNKYYVYISKHGENKLRGIFDNIDDAKNFYKKEREKYIREVANEWKDRLEPRVYDAINNYEVQVGDNELETELEKEEF